jgi:integrase
MSLYKRGNVWWYHFRFGGQEIQESSKSKKKTLARDAERERRSELERAYNRIPKRARMPLFSVAADEWLASVKPHVAERTQNIYEVALRCHLKPALGPLLLFDIDASQIASYQAARKARGASARTLNKELQVLRQILKRYKLWGNLQGDVRFERESEGIGKAMSEEQEQDLVAACVKNPLLSTIVTLALNTALRKNEIRTLCWRQLDLIARTLTVGRTKTEGGSGRVIPLNSVAYAAVVRWASRFPQAKAEDYVFPACEDARIDTANPNEGKIDASRPMKGWRTAWRRALKDAGLNIRFHDLRHTCITKLAEGQASEQTLMAIAGHVSRKMLEHYSHIRMEAKRAALDAIAKPVFVGEVVQNPLQSPTGENAALPN